MASNSLIGTFTFLAVFIVVFFVGTLRQRKQVDRLRADVKGTRSWRIRGHLFSGFYHMGLAAVIVAMPQTMSVWIYLLSGIAALAFVSALIESIKQPTERDYRRAFALDRTRCGCCRYDISHTEVATCPECGWEIPEMDQIKLQSPTVWQWWRRWQIAYLERPQRACWVMAARCAVLIGLLVGLIVYAQQFAGAGGNSFFNGFFVVQVFLILGLFSTCLNLVRVIQYLLRGHRGGDVVVREVRRKNFA